MAISDLMEKAQSAFNSNRDGGDGADVPDDPGDLLDDPEDLLPPDPKPNRRSGPTKARKPTGRVTAAQRKTVKDGCELMLTALAGTWALRDPHCGGAALDAADPVAARLVPIICRNPRWLEWFTEGDGLMDYLGLAIALRPVASAVWGHHVTGKAGREVEQDAADYAAYTAPSYG